LRRRAGVVVPVFSLRSDGDWGIGEIPDLVELAAWAHDAGISVIQILPVHVPGGGQNSPYSAVTTSALDLAYLALEDIPELGEIPAALKPEIARLRAAERVEWEAVRRVKQAALDVCFARFVAHDLAERTGRAQAFHKFCVEEMHWLEDWALYAALHEEAGGKAWWDWEPGLAHRDHAALAVARDRLGEQVQRHRYVQWLLDTQWRAARAGAHALGVELMGDLPFMVGGDSADVWARAGEFERDLRLGVPPDAFSEEGQDWGLPVYRWDVIARGGFAWMHERARRAADLYQLYRVDHVVGLYRTFYRRPGEKVTGQFTPATEEQQTWLGEHVLEILRGGDRDRVIAEDLGVVPDFVRASLARIDVPGYRVLRWEKDGPVVRDPQSWPVRSLATTGTHDTESLLEWWDALPDAERDAFYAIPGIDRSVSVLDAMLDVVYRSPSELALFPLSDLLGTRERINVPGTVDDQNWTWRMPRTLSDLGADAETIARLRGLSTRSGRVIR
jgi:4-alpha-glucanotransferase